MRQILKTYKWISILALLSAVMVSAAFTVSWQVFPIMERLAKDFAVNYVQEHAEFLTTEKIDDIAALESATNAFVEETLFRDVSLEGSILRLLSKNERINLAAVVEGEKLVENGSILLSSTFARAKGLKPGDDISVLGKGFHITGLVALPTYIYPFEKADDELPVPDSFGLGVITKSDFEKIGGGKHVYSVFFTAKNGETPKESTDVFRGKLSEMDIEITDWKDIGEIDQNMHIGAFTARMKKNSFVMTALLLAAACAVWLLAVGRRVLSTDFLIVSVSSSLVGGILGTIVGLIAVRPLIELLTVYYDLPLININISFLYALTAASITPAAFALICLAAMKKPASKTAIVPL